MKANDLQAVIPDEIRVTGRLHEDARMTCTPETASAPPVAVITFQLHPAKGMPYLVQQVLGSDPSSHIVAAAKARTLKRGAAVQVFAKGLRARTDHGIAALQLMEVTHVFPLSTNQATHTEATTTEKASPC